MHEQRKDSPNRTNRMKKKHILSLSLSVYALHINQWQNVKWVIYNNNPVSLRRHSNDQSNNKNIWEMIINLVNDDGCLHSVVDFFFFLLLLLC